MKNHQPMPIAIYENVGAKVAATAYFTRKGGALGSIGGALSARPVVGYEAGR
jgi:hypothetical protein